MAQKQTRSFNVKMDEDQYAMLQQLATDAGVKKADIMRQGVSARFQQRYANVPKCSTGNPCLCPQMHILQNQPQDTDAELLQKVKLAENV